MNLIGLVASNWLWATAAVLTALLTYWYAEERGETNEAAETIDRVTDRAEAATGGVLSGFRALVLGVLGIALTALSEMFNLFAAVDELAGGLFVEFPFFVGYVLYGALSIFGVSVGIDQRTLGFGFILLLVISVLLYVGHRNNAEAT